MGLSIRTFLQMRRLTLSKRCEWAVRMVLQEEDRVTGVHGPEIRHVVLRRPTLVPGTGLPISSNRDSILLQMHLVPGSSIHSNSSSNILTCHRIRGTVVQ